MQVVRANIFKIVFSVNCKYIATFQNSATINENKIIANSFK